MPIHVPASELAERRARACAALVARGLDGLLVFRQESMYWLTGYDTFGYVFFQCLYLGADGDMVSYQNTAGRVALPHGLRIAGWFGIEGTILGDGRAWDQARFNAFPSRAAFMAVALDPDRLAAQGAHREVAIADTYTMSLRPFIDRLTGSLGA